MPDAGCRGTAIEVICGIYVLELFTDAGLRSPLGPTDREIVMRPNLPSKIGAELILLAQSPEVLRWLNWQGFGIFDADQSALRLRRWCRPGVMMKEPEPHCPAGAGRLIIAQWDRARSERRSASRSASSR